MVEFLHLSEGQSVVIVGGFGIKFYFETCYFIRINIWDEIIVIMDVDKIV